MCGRARCTLQADRIPRACHRGGDASIRTIDMDRYRPRYNIAPGSNVPVIRRDDGSNDEAVVLHCMRWGLVPSFTKKTEKPDFYRMFNARAESIGEKASFRRLIPKNRCLVAVEGFYEWKKDGSKKQPHYIYLKDGRPLVFAALYDSWENSEGEKLFTFTIITTPSSPAIQWLHGDVRCALYRSIRMPVILGDKNSSDLWLNESASSKCILRPYADLDLVWHPVTPAMGKTSFDGPECVKELQLKVENKATISNFFTKKEIKEEGEIRLAGKYKTEESKKEQKPSREDSASSRMKMEKSVKEEPEAKENIDTKDPDSKSGDYGVSKLPYKRDLEEVKVDTDTLNLNPARKKANLKSPPGDKQSTLLSFFQKK